MEIWILKFKLKRMQSFFFFSKNIFGKMCNYIFFSKKTNLKPNQSSSKQFDWFEYQYQSNIVSNQFFQTKQQTNALKKTCFFVRFQLRKSICPKIFNIIFRWCWFANIHILKKQFFFSPLCERDFSIEIHFNKNKK